MGKIFQLFQEQWSMLALFMPLVILWGLVIVRSTEDDDKRKLAPNFAARMFFILSFIIIYLGIVTLCVMAPDVIQKITDNPIFGSNIGQLITQISDSAPLFGFLALFPVYTIPQIKQILRYYVIWLHNENYRSSDESILTSYLQTCNFDPSQTEVQKNIEYLRKFELYITQDKDGPLKFETVDSWRKVSSLLRLIEQEFKNKDCVLPEQDRELYDSITEAHKRKSELAVNIIRIIDHLQGSAALEQKLTKISSVLGDVSHSDRVEVASSELAMQQFIADILSRQRDDDVRPLRLSARQTSHYLGTIERYFLAEYRIMLEQTAKLAAKAVFRAGDLAPERLSQIKSVGFSGIGHIDKINFDHILWVIMLAFPLTFIAFFISALARDGSANVFQNPQFFQTVSSISINVTVSTLIGAIWGSRRSLAERHYTPWGAYLVAGLVAVGAFCIISSIRIAVTGSQATLWQSLPWSVSLLALTIGICRLARTGEWTWAINDERKERLTDGGLLALVNVTGGLLAIAVHMSVGTPAGERFIRVFADGSIGPLLLNQVLRGAFIGFVLGFVIVRDIRHIARSRIIDPDLEKPKPFVTLQNAGPIPLPPAKA